MPAPDKIKQLVQTFEQNLNEYHTRKNETELRREFLDPFFEALGWDVSNAKGLDERRKEVAHELSVEIDGQQKKADYAFRVGTDKFDFLVEAKKPSVKIESHQDSAFQVKRYGWSAKLPINILTDFEHFAVYDCRVKPNYKDKVTAGRISLFHYKDYIEKWDEIAALFSPDAIRTGALDEFTQGLKTKKGTADVDDDFLAEIERWRDLLARNIANRNKDKGLTESQLNYAVQMTIDRIVFLRIAEERGMEEYGRLQALTDPHPSSPKSDNKNFSKKEKDPMSDLGEGSIYSELKQYFLKADERYNSGLFHFKVGKDRENPDTVTTNLEIDDKVLKDIIENLYEPKSPYAFAYIPADILGSVYERFLGKVIRLTAGGQAKVEDKPEVRKAGGVYYTPTYIVEYIVKNTVGKLTGGKTPKEVAELKIVDPACGSGSFLLGAYQYLLNWHLDWYVQDNPEKHLKNKVLLTQDNKTYRLSMTEKKRILLNNIHGVDVDPQAVEVTKLSLLLKVVEDPGQLTMFEEGHILPDLGNNIKCGNSLIGMDYFDGQLMADAAEMARVNPFDWKSEFPDVFKRGGFDAVIGNPPYLRIQGLQESYTNQIEYFSKQYKSAVKRFDLYLLFAEKGFYLLKNNGVLGFICPHKFINSDFGSGLRTFLIEKEALKTFISFGNNLIFKQASTYTGLLFLQNSSVKKFNYFEFDSVGAKQIPQILGELSEDSYTTYEIKDFSAESWILTKKNAPSILQTLSRQPQTLGDICEEILVGVQSGIDNIHLMKFEKKSSGDTLFLFSERANEIVEIERELVKPIMRGEDIKRYEVPENSYFCIYPYQLIGGKTKIIEENDLKERFPKGFAYLKKFQKELTEIRERQKTNPKYWYSCHRSRDMNVFESARIITPEISLGCNMTFSPQGLYHNTKVYSIVPSKSRKEDKFYWLGLLNSKIMWWYLSSTGYVLRGGYFVFKTNYLTPFPIRTINFSDPAEKAKHDQMVTLVERMLALHKSLASAKTPQEKESVQRQIESTDGAIDKLVYELYGLTEQEIGIVES